MDISITQNMATHRESACKDAMHFICANLNLCKLELVQI